MWAQVAQQADQADSIRLELADFLLLAPEPEAQQMHYSLELLDLVLQPLVGWELAVLE